MIIRENFDTNIFGKDVYKMFLKKRYDKSFLSKKILNIKKSLIFCFSVFDEKNIKILKDLDFDFISIRETYFRLSNSVKELTIKKGFRIYSLNDKIPLIDKQSLKQMAMTLGKTSRYFKDSKISTRDAMKFYITWLDNSLYRSYADNYFLIFKDKKLAGLVTLKIKNNSGFIDLIGVMPTFQNLGLGSLLLNKSLNFFKEKDIDDVFVITEGENIQAGAFYQKNGFIKKYIELVYHKHLC